MGIFGKKKAKEVNENNDLGVVFLDDNQSSNIIDEAVENIYDINRGEEINTNPTIDNINIPIENHDIHQSSDMLIEQNVINSQENITNTDEIEHYTEQNMIYQNTLDLEEKRTFGDKISDVLIKIFTPIIGLFKKYKEANQKSLDKQQEKAKQKFKNGPLVIDFNGEDAKKLPKKVVWRYKAIDKDNKLITGYFEALSKVDVYSYLVSEGMTVYEILTNSTIQLFHGNNQRHSRIKNKDLVFFLTQLSTYIKAGIPLAEAMNILMRQEKRHAYQKIFQSVVYDLTVGDNFSLALEKQGRAFPGILITMVKAAELTGELPETLDDMADYFAQMDATRKEMISALTYPTLVFTFAIGVVTFIMLYVVPKFVDIYSSMDASEIPSFTLLVINISNYLKANIITILLVIILILLLIIYFYRHVKATRIAMQWLFMHIPIIKDIMIYKEVNVFTKTFHSLLSHNVYITDSMNILSHVTENEIYKGMIKDTLVNLSHGDLISAAFKDHWAFPIPAYEMIVTGEKTGQLAEMMNKVAIYYQEQHKSVVSRVKSLMEPIIIVFLTVAVGMIIMAIIIPMFNLYNSVQSYG